jgi:hypothetical protein
MKSTVLTAALVAAYGSDQAHLSGGEAHDAARHQEECDAGIVVNCQVEEGWQWSACDETCGYDRVPYAYQLVRNACSFHTRNVTCSYVRVASVQPGPLDALPRRDRRGVQRRRRLPASGPDQAVHGQYLHLRTAHLSGEKRGVHVPRT